MIFDALKNKAADMALASLKDNIVNPNIEGIGVVKEISLRDGKLFLTLVLDGLEDRDIEVSCCRISIADDCSGIALSDFRSNMPFAANALNRFAPKTFSIPEGGPRLAIMAARKALGL